MGWFGGHLSAFAIHGSEYATDGDCNGMADFGDFARDVRGNSRIFKVKPASLRLSKGDVFTYEYDFGDDWEHAVKAMSTDYRPEGPVQRFGCYGGERSCPPEDCGGPICCQELLRIRADPDPDPDTEDGMYDEMSEMPG
jgi:hypothetical protein